MMNLVIKSVVDFLNSRKLIAKSFCTTNVKKNIYFGYNFK